MKKDSVKNIRKNIMHVIGGTILTEDFFLKNTRFMLVLFVILVMYISNRYSCIEQIAEIEDLRKKLKNEKYESLVISSELTGISRRSKVESRIEKENIGVKPSRTPVYIIEKQK